MPLVPIRDLGSTGVITDVDPFDLPGTAFTMAVNARFEDKRITRGPVFSTAGTLVSNTHPRFAVSYKQLSGNTQFLIANDDGTINSWAAASANGASTETNLSISGYTPNTVNSPYTATIVNDVVYINRPDRVPWFKTKSAAGFTALAGGWDASWRCASLRSVQGVLVAINVTKGATAYPTMIKTSDFTTFDSTPGAWVASPTNSATENVLSDLQEPLVDGVPLRQNLILYSNNETWMMQYRGDNLMFNYYRLFTSAGVISQNCVAEYNSLHFVFGNDDIWSHDGYNRKTIATGRVRSFVFDHLVRAQSNQFFTLHNPRLNEILFCYVSTDPYCQFPAGSYPGCNRAAVYNYHSNTWYFYDLPYVTSAALGVPFTGATYAQMASISYSSFAGSYSSLNDSSLLSVMMVSPGASGSSYGSLGAAVRSFTPPRQAAAAGIADPVATAPVFIERAYIDMDDYQQQLRGYKVVKGMYPEGHFDPGAGPLSFSVASADYPSSPLPSYDGPAMTFDGGSNYQLDFRSAGRYLSLKITYAGQQGFSLSGLDFDFEVTGRR